MRRSAALICGAVILTACGDVPSNPESEVDGQQAATQGLARGIAQALAKPDLRAELFAAFQSSPWAEHKLILQRFVRTEPGRKLLDETASSLRRSPSDLLRLIDGLPELDFYVPFRENRSSWHGAEPVIVGAAFELDAPTLEATDADGKAVMLRLEDGAPTTTLVILHPAQRKFFRSRAKPAGTGTLADGDAPFSSRVDYMPGVINSANEEDCSQVDWCDPEPGGGPVYGPPPPGLYIEYIYSHRGDGWGGNVELYIAAFTAHGRGLMLSDDVIHWDWTSEACNLHQAWISVSQHEAAYPAKRLIPDLSDVSTLTCGSATEGHGLAVRVWEIDGSFNDDFGHRLFYDDPQFSPPTDAHVGADEVYISGFGWGNLGDKLSVNMRLGYR